LSFHKFVDLYRGHSVIDNKENPELGRCEFSDESLFRFMVQRWNRPERIIQSPRGFDTFTDTIDRSHWFYDPKRLLAGGYVESHTLKPPAKWQNELRPIYKYLGVDL
jgi:hypothetical protein